MSFDQIFCGGRVHGRKTGGRQIRTLVSAYMEQFDRNNFMQNILLGNMLVVDMYNKAQKLHIEQAERVVFVIELEGKKDATAIELVKNLFAAKTRDFVTEVDEQSIVLIKDTREMGEDEDLVSLASMIVDNMHAEAMVRVRVGYGNRVNNLQDIAEILTRRQRWRLRWEKSSTRKKRRSRTVIWVLAD